MLAEGWPRLENDTARHSTGRLRFTGTIEKVTVELK